ncbi:hypothetical protein RIF29_14586 [Crotalaria pallida]|uniref:Uncharacterized protein n=1 Tax=Crotalaria pallida TaxID=3830 RepID=A0AAN9FE30_CROPI
MMTAVEEDSVVGLGEAEDDDGGGTTVGGCERWWEEKLAEDEPFVVRYSIITHVVVHNAIDSQRDLKLP